jgi:hypothetical protein
MVVVVLFTFNQAGSIDSWETPIHHPTFFEVDPQ